MKASIFLAIAAFAAATGTTQAQQLNTPGGAQPGMQADGEGRSALPLLRAVRPADDTRGSGQPAGSGDGRATPPTHRGWVWQRAPFLDAGSAEGSRGAASAPADVSAGDNTAYPR